MFRIVHAFKHAFVYNYGRHITVIPPWPVPRRMRKEEGWPAPASHKNLPATETTAKEFISPGRRSEADHANGYMTTGDQSREDVSSSIADLMSPKRRTRVGFRKVSVKNIGFTLDCHLNINAHVSNIARTCYFEMRRLASIRRFLTSTATATLVSAFALSRIDYCISLLFASTHDVTFHLQRMQNYATRVILRLPKSSSISTHLKSLLWLPVKVRSTYKIACLCYHCHISTAPSYLADMLHRSHRTLTPAHTPCLFSIDQHTVVIIIIMVIFKCYLSGELIALS